MMTREEVCEILEHPLHNTSEFALKRNKRILDHDQAQRAVIDRYREQVDEQAVDIIDHIDEKHKLSKQIEQQAKEIESLTEQFHENLERQAKRVGELEAENKTMREALQLLYDTQNGCPLPKYEADWNRAMELAARALREKG